MLYEYYDSNDDDAIDIEEWALFAEDIVDEGSPHYKDILEAYGMAQPNEEL